MLNYFHWMRNVQTKHSILLKTSAYTLSVMECPLELECLEKTLYPTCLKNNVPFCFW